MTVSADGRLHHLSRSGLATLFGSNDLIVANDAAVLPASLTGSHEPSGKPLEVRLAGWPQDGRPGVRFIALAFGAGDHRIPTEDRRPPPPLQPGDRLELGPLSAFIERLAGHPRTAGSFVLKVTWMQSGPALPATDGRFSMRMYPNPWPCGMCGPISLHAPLPSNRRRRDCL